MRYGVIADIHSNLEALEEVLSFLEKERVERVLCLGDMVGYGPNPNECVEKVRKTQAFSLLGNHEWAIFFPEIQNSFNPVARKAIEWTSEELSLENKEFLAGLLLKGEIDGFSIVHSTWDKPEEWRYILSLFEAEFNFFILRKDICFFAHSHQAVAYRKKGELDCEEFYFPEGGEITLEEGCRWLINPGAVGQPRDGNPQSSFGIYDAEERKFTFFRIEYEREKTKKKILKAGLPSFLAERLEYGL